nr:restriction endonuclease subunit S [Paenibacillus anseongense]
MDELIESVFIEFFGDLNINNKNWEFRELQYFADLSSGVTKGKKYNDSKVLSLPYMRVANVQDGFLNLSEIKEISVSEKDAARYQLRKRDLLLTEGGDPDKLGRGAVWEEEVNNCIHQNHIFRVRIENENLLNAYFLSKCTGSSYGKKYFLKMAKQTTGIATINMTQLKNFPVPLPPIDLQRKYETLIHEVQEQKRLMYDHLLKLQESFQSLLQRAFRGQLEIK